MAGQDVAKTGAGSEAPWQPPQLAPSLEALVEIDWIWEGARAKPALGAGERAGAEAALAVYRQMPRGTGAGRLAKMIGAAAIGFPSQRLSEKEADVRVTLYQRGLCDVDEDVLAAAFAMAMRECVFFPTIAEIRAFAKRVPTPRRKIIAGRLRALLADPVAADPAIAPEDLVRPEQMQELIKRLGSSLHA